ncbi:MAG: GspE/PulE family protein [Bdellovibrionales bacterium]
MQTNFAYKEPLPPTDSEDLLGQTLLAQNLISTDQLRIALHEQKTTHEMLGAILLRLGFLDHKDLMKSLAARAGLESIDLDATHIDTSLLVDFPKEAAQRSLCLPLIQKGRKLHVAMADPFDIVALDEIRRYFHGSLEITPHVATRMAIEEQIEFLYGSAYSIDAIIHELENSTPLENPSDNDEDDYEHPLIRLVNALLIDAVRKDASDIHFEPEDNFIRIRLRIDGTLRQTQALHLSHWPSLSHRIKFMAGMNIAETRKIQDGRFKLTIGAVNVDFRAAIMPTVWGETIAIRLLNHTKSLVPLERLGYTEHALNQLEQISRKPQGITLFTGPTGSGKTTTLYSLLQKLSSTDVHVATLEEPVEFQLDLIRQTSIHDEQGLDFAAGVRGLLRMDPDIIFIGEIRDPDTAQMALRAAMTGHQVFSTLHCNDALGALPRLIDLGLNPRLLAGNLSGFVAQRLVRKLCPVCKKGHIACEEECRLLRVSSQTAPHIFEAHGCPQCEHTGFKGRTVIAEVIPISTKLDDLIAIDAPRLTLIEIVREEGFMSLQEDGIKRVLAGETSLTELMRTADLSKGDQ